MGRMYYEHNEYKIYEVSFPVGGDAMFFVIINDSRHYFKSLTQAKLYLDHQDALST